MKRPAAGDSPRSHLALVRDSEAASPLPPLLPRIAAGDDRAVSECITRYGALVWSLARRWTPDAADAEDAVQEVFIDLWRTAARYESERITEAGWVAMVARRRLIDRARMRGRRPEHEEMNEETDAPADNGRDLDQEMDRESRSEAARQVLRELPPAQRRMLELSLLHGKTHDEIARETDTPLGTVKSHIRRGLQRARELLATRLSTEVGEE